jgi:disulfide oxidoreductase YuzD
MSDKGADTEYLIILHAGTGGDFCTWLAAEIKNKFRNHSWTKHQDRKM